MQLYESLFCFFNICKSKQVGQVVTGWSGSICVNMILSLKGLFYFLTYFSPLLTQKYYFKDIFWCKWFQNF